MKLRKMVLKINGVERIFMCDPQKDRLSDVLRRIGLTGVKVGCGAVQCGFCVPGFIVSAYGLLQKNPDPTREEVRDWFYRHKNACRCTGYKQIVDAVMLAAKVLRGECSMEDERPKEPEDGSYFGRAILRPDALSKVCGLADYGDDQALKMPPGTLHAAVIQPRKAHHARILAIHTEEAEHMPGVVKVITAKDLLAAGGTNLMEETHKHKRSTVKVPSRKVFQDEKIHRWGDVVGLVVADTRDHAREAAARVTVDLEPLPEYLTYLDAVRPEAVRVHEDTPNLFCRQPVLKGVGLEDAEKVKALIDHAPFVAEGSFFSSRQPHLTIEGDPIQAYWGEDGKMTIQCKSQGIYSSIDRIGGVLGIPKENYRIIQNPTGASFGWSANAGDLCLAAAAVLITGEPVSLSMSYEEHQHFSGKRCPSYSNGRIGCREDGKLLAAEFDFGYDHGAYSVGGDGILTRPARFVFFPYSIPNAAGLTRIANTNHSFGVACRSFGSPQAYLLSESLMDMMAEKLGMDPFEFRYRNIARPGDTNMNSYPYKQYPMEAIMDRMRPVYEAALAAAKTEDTPEKRRGVGLSWGGFNVTEGASDHAEVVLELLPGGKIQKYDTWHEMGQGGSVGSLMVTLEALKELRLKPEDIHLIQNDTGCCPDTGKAGASRSFYMCGHATRIAAEKLLSAMRKEDGSFRTFEEMKADGLETKYLGRYEVPADTGLCELDPNTGIGDPAPAYTYCLNLAEVQVDTQTGKAEVLKFTCIDGAGRIGNIDAVNGQAYSGIAHGIGFALSENYHDVDQHAGLAGAGIPYSRDIPDEIQLIHLEAPLTDGPFGSSGASEAYQSSGHCAVLNAIYNACGVRIHELPARPEKIKAGLDAIAMGEKPYAPEKYFLGSDLYEELKSIKNNPV